jgi:hypothetical protein
MTDFKLFLRKFDGSKTSDFGLWLCRLEAFLDDKGIAHAIEPEEFPSRSFRAEFELPSASILAESAELGAARKKSAPSSSTAWAISPFELLFLIAEILR